MLNVRNTIWGQVVSVACIGWVGIATTGCTKVGFETSKAALLSGTSVMGNGDTSGQIQQPADPNNPSGGHSGPGGGSSGQIQHPGDGSGTISPTQPSVPINRVCSDKRSAAGPNFKRAMIDHLPMALMVNDQSCVTGPAQLQQIVMGKSLTLAQLKSLCPNLVTSGSNNVRFDIQGVSTDVHDRDLDVLYARNTDTTMPEEDADQNCTTKMSPLVIHMGTDRFRFTPIQLTAPWDGVLFDILGMHEDHEKIHISWFTNFEYGFLVLPDQNGEVNGIDQMFGNNTFGPDHAFAANGYAALAKYDGMSADGLTKVGVPDGFIDKNDAVFSRLRVWVDENLDGVCSPNELMSLDEAGIEFIDLRYSSQFQETDQYGNETRMKSVVGLKNGSLDLIFDLWFVNGDIPRSQP